MRGDFIGSFAQGARLGAAVTGFIILAVVLGAVATLREEPSAGGIESFAVPLEVRELQPVKKRPLADHEIDRVLLEAARARERAVREMVFEMGRIEHAPSPTPTPEPVVAAAPAPAVAPPAPTPAAAWRPPVIVQHDELYAILEEAFPEQVDRAYRIVMCESSGNATANTGNGYFGMWQFDLATWRSVGGTGYPSDASVEEQVRRARMLYDARGWSPWGCS